MKKERYYYGEIAGLADIPCALSKNQEVLLTGELKNFRNTARVTVCGIWDTDKKEMSFGVARCSAKDMFIKATGRKLARERALNTPYRVVKIRNYDKVPDVFIENAVEIDKEVGSMPYPRKLHE